MVSQKNRATQAFRIQNALLARYKLKDFGKLNWFLGIQIIRDCA